MEEFSSVGFEPDGVHNGIGWFSPTEWPPTQWGRGELRSVYRQKNAPKSYSINILKTLPV